MFWDDVFQAFSDNDYAREELLIQQFTDSYNNYLAD